jgi:predicted permease
MLLQIFGLFLNVVAPVFGIVLLGYTIGPRLRLDARSLSRVAYYVFLPAFVFNAISTADFDLSQVTRAVGYIIAVHLASAAIGFMIARLLRRSWEITAAYVLIALFGNVGNFGVAIIGFKMGPSAVPLATLYFVAVNMTAFVIGVGFASWLRKGRGWFAAVLAVFKTPAIIVMVPALFFQAGGFDVPLMPARIIGLLAGAMIPTLLFVVGQNLAEAGPMKLDRDVYVASTIRLVVAPLMALALAVPLQVTGLDRGAGILQAGMPVAVLATIIAMEFDLVPKFVTTVLFFTTLASLFTITVMLYLL